MRRGLVQIKPYKYKLDGEMNPTDLQQIGLPILIVAAVLGGLVFVIYKLSQESRRDGREWDKRSRTLHCPHCGASYDGWSGESWGVDAEPPEFGSDGVVLVCCRCNDRGYVREHDGTFKVYPLIEDAAEPDNLRNAPPMDA